MAKFNQRSWCVARRSSECNCGRHSDVHHNTASIRTTYIYSLDIWGQCYTSNVENSTGPEYEGRITLFLSTGSLELRYLTLNDSGEYTVVIQPQTEPLMEGSTRLEVYEPVSNVMVTPSNSGLMEFSSSVNLSCTASGSSLSFLWLDGSSEVTDTDRLQLTDENSTLTIVNVTRYDQERFRCRVSNPVSSGTSDPVTLSIIYGPENVTLTLSPSQESYVEGSSVTLSCSAVCSPSALFSWILNGRNLTDTGPELKLVNIQMSQSGNYSCQAFNNITLRYETSLVVSVLTIPGKTSGCSAGCIAGIVIACLLVCAAAAAGGYYIFIKRARNRPPPQTQEKEVEEPVSDDSSDVYDTVLN
ncbi:carcinoembryonic antigen-related cell adhesion molecule 6-like [Sparus aurata]|uniref:carcinoembryonic antigen-related cell adhesion molecule 6-like n=1 Tax=Sparus aurata TaxID=8175 RepID=UPI0011C12360|nr:carcinoembryonic antigen-related cell adhesion molecule 6-like [Sparus aurata]